jgi:iron(III) transport system substrate-binding protein
MRKISSLLKTLAVLTWAAFPNAGIAQSPDWQKTWDETLAAAKKEGKVVVMGSPDPVMRNQVVPAFSARYGIPIEYIAGQSGPLAERVRIERDSGIYSVDVFMSGVGTTFNTLLPLKMLDPIKPILLLPEVTDGSKWKFGKPYFMDAEEKNVLMLFRSRDSLLFINADHVKPEEMKSATDLLNPKWKGKIETQDPLGSGSGGDTAVHFYTQMGPDFVKKLYIDQAPVRLQDRRQLMDRLARGANPICLTCKFETASDLQKEGFNIREIFDLAGMKNRVTSSPFVLSMANKAAHPNAAHIFVNWVATREVLEIYSRENGTATLRTDVDESFLNPEIVPKAGVEYFESTDLEWMTTGRPAVTEKMRALLKGNR